MASIIDILLISILINYYFISTKVEKFMKIQIYNKKIDESRLKMSSDDPEKIFKFEKLVLFSISLTQFYTQHVKHVLVIRSKVIS